MPQPTFTAVRNGIATYLASHITGLRATGNRPLQINPPMAVIVPVQGSFARYSVTMDGEVDYTVRVIVVVAPADSTAGEDTLDPYVATSGPQSIWAAVQADPTLGGVVSSASVTEATGYGVMNMSGIDYLACQFIVNIEV